MDGRGARLTYLDGLRGWAALSVVIFHSTWEMFGPELRQFRSTWPGPLNDGPLAVSIFFILSGVVLTAGTSGPNGRIRLRQMAVGRYFRLTIPILGACFIGYLLMISGLLFNYRTKEILDNSWVWRMMSQQVPSIQSWLFYSFYDVYFTEYNVSSGYNNFLWTMPIEFFGSIILLGTIGLFGKKRNIRVGAFILGFVIVRSLLRPGYELFFCGAILFESIPVMRGIFDKKITNLVGIFAFGIGCVISIYFRHQHNFIAGILIVFGVMSNFLLQSLMQLGISQWLGRISFPLYLVHCYIVFGPACWLIIQLHTLGFGLPASAAIICPFSVVASLALAQAFLPVEIMAISLARLAGSIVKSPPSLPDPSRA